MKPDTVAEEATQADDQRQEQLAEDAQRNGVTTVQFSKDDLFLDITRTLISYLITDPLRDEVIGVRQNVEFICRKVGKSAVRIDWRRFESPASE